MNIREEIKSQGLLFDGAMGTYLAQRTQGAYPKCEIANLSAPEEVLAIHRAYGAAGCRAFKTNTFGANRLSLDGDEKLLRQVIEAGWSLAAQAAGEYGAYVFGDVGPVDPAAADPAEEYRLVADLLLEQGATNFLFETMSSAVCLEETADYIRKKCPEAYLIASFAVQPDGYTREGLLGRELFAQLKAGGRFDALGFNCVSGAYHILQLIRGLDHEGITLSVMPNAGYPRVIGNRTFFEGDPSYFAFQMGDMAKAGAAILGGCCGTTPEHLEKTAQRVKDSRGERAQVVPPKAATVKKPVQPNRLWEKLSRGERVIAVELDPPAGDDVSKFMSGAWTLKGAGVDAITIADCPIARPRIDSSLLACKLRRELGIDPLPHITCRDRNGNATKALLLGLAVEGVRNVLVITGDPIPSAQRDEVKAVFNFNSRKLARYIKTLNEQEFSAPFHICGALNVNALRFEHQLEMAKEKVANGVSTFLTQPVLTRQAVENLRLAYETLDAKILGGIMPVVSHRNACFMNSEIPGIRVEEEIIRRYEGKSKEECRALAVEISAHIAKEIAPICHGYYLMTPFQRVDIITDIIKEIRRE